MAYPLGWSVIPQMVVRRERWPGGYKIKAIPLVYPGQEVQPDSPIMRLQKSDLPPSMTEIPHRMGVGTRLIASRGRWGHVTTQPHPGEAQKKGARLAPLKMIQLLRKQHYK